MSIARSLIIFSVIILVILLVLVFAAPDAWAQCVGACDSGSSADLSGSGNSLMDVTPFATTTVAEVAPTGAATPAIVPQRTSEPELRLGEHKRRLQEEFMNKRNAMKTRPDLLAALDQPKYCRTALEVQEIFEQAERENKFHTLPEGPYGPKAMIKQTIFGHKSRSNIKQDILSRKQELIRRMRESLPPEAK
jgi:hypothetical protein